jgi:hypothetical protein
MLNTYVKTVLTRKASQDKKQTLRRIVDELAKNGTIEDLIT